MTDDGERQLPHKLMTLKEVAERLAVSERTVRDLVDAGDMSFVDLSRGRKRRLMRFHPEDLDAFIERRRTIVRPPLPARKVTLSAPVVGAVDFLAILAKRKVDERRR